MTVLPLAKHHYAGTMYMNILAKQNSRSLKELSSLQRHSSLDEDAASKEAEQLKVSGLARFRQVLRFTRSKLVYKVKWA